MKFKEFGNGKNPTIILIHGGGLSWWSFKEIIEDLKNHYLVIAAIIDGHGDDSESPFISIEDCAKKLVSYIEKEQNGKVHLLAGLSLGAQIITEVLSTRENITGYAILESCLVYPIAGTKLLTVPAFRLLYGLVKMKWFAKLQAKTLFVPEDLFENYYQDSIKMSKQSLMNIGLSNGNYSLKEEMKNSSAKTVIIVGDKELGIMKKSAKKLHEIIPNSTLYIPKNMGHGELSLVHHKRYLETIRSLLE